MEDYKKSLIFLGAAAIATAGILIGAALAEFGNKPRTIYTQKVEDDQRSYLITESVYGNQEIFVETSQGTYKPLNEVISSENAKLQKNLLDLTAIVKDRNFSSKISAFPNKSRRK